MSTHNNQCLEKEGGKALLWIPFGSGLNTVNPLKMDRDSGAPTVYITLGVGGDAADLLSTFVLPMPRTWFPLL